MLNRTESDSDRISYKTDANSIPKDGYTYHLKVEHDDYPTVTATSFVPSITKMSNVEVSDFKKSRENQLPGFTNYFSQASIEVEDNSSVENHYHLLVWLGFPNGSGIDYFPIFLDDEVLQEQLGADATIINESNSRVFFGAHFDDKEFSGNTQKLNFDISFSLHDSENPVEIKIELRSVSKDYYKYFVEGYRQSQAGANPFFVQSDNISNNVENGFGVFAGYSTFDKGIPFRK